MLRFWEPQFQTMNENLLKDLRRSNLLVRGLILKARCSDNREDFSQALSEALLQYGLFLTKWR